MSTSMWPGPFLSIVCRWAAGWLVAGCSTLSQPTGMVPVGPVAGLEHDQATSVVVAGGSDTYAVSASQVSNAMFRQAVVLSIERNKAFSSVVDSGSGESELVATIVSVEPPAFDIGVVVKMEVAWFLKKADGTVVMREDILSEGTA